MPGSVTVSTASPVGVVGALFRLALAYFDRLSAGDWARASVVLRVFADTFNEHREGVVRYFLERGVAQSTVLAQVPARVSGVYDADTRRALQTALAVGATAERGTAYRQSVESMPTSAAPDIMAGWWRPLAPVFTASEMQVVRSGSYSIAADPIASLASNLESWTNAYLYGGPADVREGQFPVPFDQPDATPLPPLFITPTRRARFVMPTWGWWAIGLGGVAAFGVLAYGVLEQGWFQKRPRRRRR